MIGNLLAGGLEVSTMICTSCNKIEFYSTDYNTEYASDLPQATCPNCGAVHDFDYPKCPHCKYQY